MERAEGAVDREKLQRDFEEGAGGLGIGNLRFLCVHENS